MEAEWEKRLRQIAKREWRGPGFVWFPIGFGWYADIETAKRNNHDEKMFGLTFKVVKPR